MWRTPEGVRVLTGSEAKLFRMGLSSLVAWLDEDAEWESGVKGFDALSIPERFALLERVAVALLEDEGDPPKQTAVNEGAIAAVYAQLITEVELLWFKGDYGKIRAVGTVDGEVVASMEATFKLVDG